MKFIDLIESFRIKLIISYFLIYVGPLWAQLSEIGEPIVVEEESALKTNGIYLLLENNFGPSIIESNKIEALDCQHMEISSDEIEDSFDKKLTWVKERITDSKSHQKFYVGKVSTKQFEKRNFKVRIKEHNRKIPNSQSRLYTYLRENPTSQLMAYSLAYNCPPEMVKAIETYAIRFFEANYSANGLNSNIGNSKEFDQVLGTPQRTPIKDRKKVNLIVTPMSKNRKKVIYAIHQHDRPLFSDKKIDLKNKKLNHEEMEKLTKKIRDVTFRLNNASGTGLYIGLAKNLEDRSKQHIRETFVKGHHTRKTYWLNECAKEGHQVYHEAILINVHPDNLKDIEGIIIKLSGSNEGKGKNSNSGKGDVFMK